MVDTRDLALRAHSWRNYEPDEFIEAAVEDSKREARQELQTVEAGRFYDMLKAGFNFYKALDRDELDDFAAANQDFVNWIAVYGWLEGLRRFRDYHTLDFPDRRVR